MRSLSLLLLSLLLLTSAAACDDDAGAAAPVSGANNTGQDDVGEEGEDAAPEDSGANSVNNSVNNNSAPEDASPDAQLVEEVGEDAAPDVPVEMMDAGQEDVGEPLPPCRLAELRAANRERVVLVSHPFSNVLGEDGTELRVLRLTEAGELLDEGRRVDMGFVVARVAFVPSGELALVLGERGELASVQVGGVEDVSILSRIDLPSAGYGDLHVRPDGRAVWVAGSNSTPDGGISTVQIGCEEGSLGQLSVEPGSFTPLLLTQSIAPWRDGSRMVVLGGQALFDPINELRDVRLLDINAQGPLSELGAFDIYDDFVTASRIALSPDSAVALIPNSSPFSSEGGQVAVVAINGEEVMEVQRLTGLSDASEALFSADGQTALLTQVEPGRVRVLVRNEDNTFNVLEESFRAGLGEQMAQVERGDLNGLVLIPAVDATDGPGEGPNITILRIIAKGQVETFGRLFLGAEIQDLPDAIAVQP